MADINVELAKVDETNRPRFCLWLAGGKAKQSSTTNQLKEMREDWPWPETKHAMYVTSDNYEGFDGFTYAVESKGSALVQRHRDCVIAALQDGAFDDADIVVCGSGVGALYSHFLSPERFGWRLRPTIAVYPAVDNVRMGDMEVDAASQWPMWRLAGEGSIDVVHFDNAAERDLARGWMDRCHPAAGYDCLHALKWYQFDGSNWLPPKAHDHEAQVMWSGNLGSSKGVAQMTELFAMLEALGVRTKTYWYQIAGGAEARVLEAVQSVGCECAMRLPPDAYREEAGRSKVMLVASDYESFGVGYIEMMDRGVVPVYRDLAWNEDHCGKGWPLRYKTPGEGMEMVRMVLDDYPAWSRRLRKALQEQYADPRNFGEIVTSIWQRFLASGVPNPWGPTRYTDMGGF